MIGRGDGRWVVRTTQGRDTADVRCPWTAWRSCDGRRAPTVRERAAAVLGHADEGRRHLLGGEPDLARGAALVAAVEAVRLAVTAVGSGEARAFTTAFLGAFAARVDPPMRSRLQTLLAVASDGGPDRWHPERLGVAPANRRSRRGTPGVATLPAHVIPGARRRHLAASRLDADFDLTLRVVGHLVDEMRELARRGSSTDGVRRSLADAAFAVCLGTTGSGEDADLRIELLGIIHDAQREGEPSRAVIRAGMALEAGP